MSDLTAGNKPAPVRALVSPQLDFWLLGGFSLALAAIIFGAKLLKIELSHSELAWWAYYAAFAINFPHFAHSYQLFYAGFMTSLLSKDSPRALKMRLAVSGIIVPAAIIAYFVYCYAIESKELFGHGIAAMFFFVGWHYVKQGYGALITLSVYKKIYYHTWEKRILYFNAYMVWLYTWCKLNMVVYQQTYMDATYFTFGIPPWIVGTTLLLMIVSSILSIKILFHAWRFDGRGISFNGLTGYVCGTYIWVLFPYASTIFFLFVPLFHSLQYLPFVWKYKSSEIKKTAQGEAASMKKLWIRDMAFFIAFGMLLGAVFMDWLPKWIDTVAPAMPFTGNFYFIAILLFINIHHYFIDHAFWRRDNWKVQEYLFKS